jgi:hypothetical protein
MGTRLRDRNPRVLVGAVDALALVDRALRRASRRAFLSRDEALTLLREVVAGIGDPALGVTAASILDGARTFYDGAQLVGRARVVEPGSTSASVSPADGWHGA